MPITDSDDDGADLERLRAWEEVLDDSTYYELLGVLEIADADGVRKAFHEFALGFHPDAHPNLEERDRIRMVRVFQRGVEAYRVLADPEARARYDLELAKGALRLTSGTTGRVATGALSLDDLCRAPGAKLHAQRAEGLITQGQLREAVNELFRALRAEDGPNPELAERIDAVTALIRLSQPPK